MPELFFPVPGTIALVLTMDIGQGSGSRYTFEKRSFNQQHVRLNFAKALCGAFSTVMTVISFGRYFFVTAWTKHLSISIEMNLKRKNTQNKLRRLDFVDENHDIMGSL